MTAVSEVFDGVTNAFPPVTNVVRLSIQRISNDPPVPVSAASDERGERFAVSKEHGVVVGLVPRVERSTEFERFSELSVLQGFFCSHDETIQKALS